MLSLINNVQFTPIFHKYVVTLQPILKRTPKTVC